jgi:hypothetical protein
VNAEAPAFAEGASKLRAGAGATDAPVAAAADSGTLIQTAARGRSPVA